MRKRIYEETKRRIIDLYKDPEQKLSLDKVARELGIGKTTAWRVLVNSNEPRRSITKYPKTDFSRDPAEQARIIGFIDDCGAKYNHKQILVHTTTTHLAQMVLFTCVFGRYGHVNKIPSYNRRCSLYQWHIYVYLNRTFDFVIEYKENPMGILAEISESGFEIIHTTSLTDAEGYVGINANKGHPRAELHIYNNKRQLLECIKSTIGGAIYRKEGGYRLLLYREEAVEALRKLPMMHVEKVAAKEIILHHADNEGIGTEALWEYRALRRKIDEEVQLCKSQARLEWIRRHGKPHRYDPDRTIPTELTLSPLFPCLTRNPWSLATLLLVYTIFF